MSADFRLVEAGDAAVSVRFASRVDPAVNARAVATAAAVRGLGLAGLRDVVVSYSGVTVYFDPLATALEPLREALAGCARRAGRAAPADRPAIEVPVCYGGAFGEDLERVAALAGCEPQEVARRHAAPLYRVYMLGFAAGFAYMGTVDETIAVPRLAVPRARVPAGSVGIAGPQTGIYSVETPGGWHLIGRTPLRSFDPARAAPFLFAPGDAVRFVPVPPARFRELEAAL